MTGRLLGLTVPILAVATLGVASESPASILYSTILGATAAGSTQPAYVSSLNLTGDVNDGGPYGFGDDYATGFTGLSGSAIGGNPYLIPTDNYVQITSLSFYGDLEPGPNGSSTTYRNGDVTYSLGASLNVVFFDKSGIRDIAATYLLPTATTPVANGPNTPSSIQVPGLHTITLSSPLYIPASGYVIFYPYLPRNTNGSNGESTPIGTVAPSFTGYFGAAPTVGTSSAGTFAVQTVDANQNYVINGNSTFSALPNPTPANPDADFDDYTYTPASNVPAVAPISTGYLQLEIDGNGLGTALPEPASLGILGLIVSSLVRTRRRT